MRLLCPNCGAQYEVPDDVIPQTGRDVQCSNCGDTWFQKHADFDDELADEFGQKVDSSVVGDGWDEESDPNHSDVDDTSSVDDQGGLLREEPERQRIDPAVADVLREEAELEAAARGHESAHSHNAGGLEQQQDFGLQNLGDDASRRAKEARVRMARMRGEPDPIEGAAVAVAGAAENSRRDLLPDIEEINSTLRSTSDRRSATDIEDPASPDSVPQVRRRRGFRRGFLLMLLLTLVALGVYKYADEIGAKIPQAEPVLSVYVEKVNSARIWLDGQVTTLKDWLESKLASTTVSGDAVDNMASELPDNSTENTADTVIPPE